jgi:hypothetical protein
MDIRSSHAYRMPSGGRSERIGQAADRKIYLEWEGHAVRQDPSPERAG